MGLCTSYPAKIWGRENIQYWRTDNQRINTIYTMFGPMLSNTHIIEMMIWTCHTLRPQQVTSSTHLHPTDQKYSSSTSKNKNKNKKQMSFLSGVYEVYFEIVFLHFRSPLINSYLTALLLHVKPFPMISLNSHLIVDYIVCILGWTKKKLDFDLNVLHARSFGQK